MFSQNFGCELTVVKDGEHWFHTKQQLDILFGWTQKSFHTKSICQNKEYFQDR